MPKSYIKPEDFKRGMVATPTDSITLIVGTEGIAQGEMSFKPGDQLTYIGYTRTRKLLPGELSRFDVVLDYPGLRLWMTPAGNIVGEQLRKFWWYAPWKLVSPAPYKKVQSSHEHPNAAR